jgi:hypothetical protein
MLMTVNSEWGGAVRFAGKLEIIALFWEFNPLNIISGQQEELF